MEEVAPPLPPPPIILCIGLSSILVIPFFIDPRFFDMMRLLRWFSNRTRFELAHEFDGIGAGPLVLLPLPLPPTSMPPPQVITSSSKWLRLDGKYFSFGTGSVSHSAKSAIILSTMFMDSPCFWVAATATDSETFMEDEVFAIFSLFILSTLSIGYLNGSLADVDGLPKSSLEWWPSTLSWCLSLSWMYFMSRDLACGLIGRFKSKSMWTMWNSPLATINILSMHCRLTNGLNSGSLSARQYFVCIVRLHLMHKKPQRFATKWENKRNVYDSFIEGVVDLLVTHIRTNRKSSRRAIACSRDSINSERLQLLRKSPHSHSRRHRGQLICVDSISTATWLPFLCCRRRGRRTDKPYSTYTASCADDKSKNIIYFQNRTKTKRETEKLSINQTVSEPPTTPKHSLIFVGGCEAVVIFRSVFVRNKFVAQQELAANCQAHKNVPNPTPTPRRKSWKISFEQLKLMSVRECPIDTHPFR